MSVMKCSRRGCNNILCKSYSRKYGYICNQCREDFIQNGGDLTISQYLESGNNHDATPESRKALISSVYTED